MQQFQIQKFSDPSKHGDAIRTCDKIVFGFYSGLPCVASYYWVYKPLQKVDVVFSMEPAHVVSCGTVWPVDLTVEWNGTMHKSHTHIFLIVQRGSKVIKLVRLLPSSCTVRS